MRLHRHMLLAAALTSPGAPALALERLDDARMAREQIAAPQAVSLTPDAPAADAPMPSETRRVDVPASRDEGYQLLLLPRYGIAIPLDRSPASGAASR